MKSELQAALVTGLEVASMTAAGASLVLADLSASLRRWRLLAIALLINFALLPAVGWLIASATAESAGGIAAAVLILAAAPGGGTGPLLALVAGADVALSVAVTFLLALGSCVLTPLFLYLGAGAHAEHGVTAPPLLQLLSALALYQLLPLAIGASVRARAPKLGERVAKLASRVAIVLLAVLAAGLVQRLSSVFVTTSLRGWCALLGLVVASLWAWLPVRDAPSRVRSLALTTGIRNCSLSLVIAARWGHQQAVVAVLQFAFTMYAVCFLYAGWARSSGLTRAPALPGHPIPRDGD